MVYRIKYEIIVSFHAKIVLCFVPLYVEDYVANELCQQSITYVD